MARTMWADANTGKALDDSELARLRERARRLYEVNAHIFEDELDALSALGAVPVSQLPKREKRARRRAGAKLVAA